MIPQKSLSKLTERIENADYTLSVPRSQVKYNKMLLIDDAVGSGATMNIAAKKIKESGLCTNIIGLGLTGSFSGFEVISEV